jgi:hypothetical protein
MSGALRIGWAKRVILANLSFTAAFMIGMILWMILLPDDWYELSNKLVFGTSIGFGLLIWIATFIFAGNIEAD